MGMQKQASGARSSGNNSEGTVRSVVTPYLV